MLGPNISRTAGDLAAPFQWNTDRKLHMANRMVMSLMCLICHVTRCVRAALGVPGGGCGPCFFLGRANATILCFAHVFSLLPPPKKETMFLLRSVCLSVRQITEKVVNGFLRNFLEG